MKVQNTQHFENFSLIQNNPSGASRHLPLHKGGFDFCETTKNRFIDTLEPHIAALFVGAALGTRPTVAAGISLKQKAAAE